ncbi:DUF4256 domain-containing protein [Acidovorax sp. GBBC 3334]|uniref:DUF4256 domain-containing protein n=1 Tax=Acidovorax sp. GBBC 3334 TaxID=2940496 RepID=UPI0023023852|nr:DUF4256 domain-containing protein [Acidovorax sp. GBBC 3334]MDA8457188.1 DUF4256 domain-containing protein [Acidovorax sp. GBBC 3334]
MKTEQRDPILDTLERRFHENPHRHPGAGWADVQARLQGSPSALRVVRAMEATGGEPDVIGVAGSNGAYLFCDCAAESPAGRRSLCYDAEALNARKQNRPENNAVDLAAAIGVSLLTESQYRTLQQFGEFDRKTSSWVATPGEVRALGGALFCDRRYGRVFVYHNGAESYYAARGFRGAVSV